MPSLHMDKVWFAGNLTQEPEQEDHGDSGKVTRFGCATNRTVKTSGGDYKDDPVFVDVSAWGKLGDFIANNFEKGDRIMFAGRHNYRTWQDNNGNKRSKLEIVAEEVQPIEEFAGEAEGDNMSDPDEILDEADEMLEEEGDPQTAAI